MQNKNVVFSPNFKVIKRGGEQKAQIIVSKKVAKRALDRNRIRRIIREAIKGQMTNFKIIVKNNIATQKSYQVEKELKPILEKWEKN